MWFSNFYPAIQLFFRMCLDSWEVCFCFSHCVSSISCSSHSVIGADAGNGIRVFIPDIGMFLVGLAIWLLCRTLVQKRPPEEMGQYNEDFDAEEQVGFNCPLSLLKLLEGGDIMLFLWFNNSWLKHHWKVYMGSSNAWWILLIVLASCILYTYKLEAAANS